MRNISYNIIIVLLSIPFISFGQERLSPQGDIPKMFISQEDSELYKVRGEDEGLSSKEKKLLDNFYEEANFTLNATLQNGNVIFNDKLSSYTNKLLDEILEKLEFDTRQFEVYLINSSYLNAFATPQGLIFVTTGLIAKMENEAELAFILCHEISHVVERHGLETYSKEQENKKWIDVNEDADYDRAMFSQEKEFQADSLGLEYFLKTGYSIANFDALFDKLYFSNTGLVEFSFPKSYFESENLSIPDSLWAQELTNLLLSDSFDPDESTHPSSQERLEEISETLSYKNQEDSGVNFLYNENDFRKTVLAARYEIPFLDFENGDYSACIYNAYFVVKDFPESKELKEIMIHAIRNILVLKVERSKYDDLLDDDRYEDDEESEIDIIEFEQFANDSVRFEHSEQIDLFINKLSVADVLAIAFEKVMPLAVDTSNTDIQDIKGDLFYTLRKLFPSQDSLTKYNCKLQASEVLQAYLVESDYGDELNIASERIKDNEDRLEYFDSEEFVDRLENMNKKGFKLGVNKVLVVDPSFRSVSFKDKEVRLNIDKSIKKETLLLDYAKYASKDLGMKAQVLDLKKLKQSDVEIAKDIWEIKKDYRTYMAWPSREYRVIYGRKEMDSIYEKYGTNKVLFMNAYTFKGDLYADVVKKYYLVYGFPFYFPLYWVDLIEASRYSGFESVLYYPNQHGLYVIKNDEYRYRNSPAMLKSKVYDTLNQIKTKSKEK